MKQILHRVFSCLMAFLLLASTMSWTVGKHYCMGRLMDVSLFEHAESCGMDMNMDKDDGTATFQDGNTCCADELISTAGQDDLKISFNEIRFDHQLLLVAFMNNPYLDLFNASAEPYVPNKHYPQPLLVKDIQLLDEVFLI